MCAFPIEQFCRERVCVVSGRSLEIALLLPQCVELLETTPGTVLREVIPVEGREEGWGGGQAKKRPAAAAEVAAFLLAVRGKVVFK